MAKLAFLNARLITPEELIMDSALLVEDERILGSVNLDAVPDEFAPIDLNGCWLAPGFVDIHVHGAAGADALDADIEALKRLMKRHMQFGTTALYPTLISAPYEQTVKAVEVIDQAMHSPDLRGKILGAHLEGPFLSPEYRGAHDIRYLRVPNENEAEWQSYLDNPAVKLITIAPELAGSEELVRAAVSKGIKISVGHSGAGFDLLRHARNWGANQCSHIFNAMSGVHHRDPGTAGSLLTLSAYYAQFIADGIHLHPALLHIIVRCKGMEKAVLVSDAIRCAGMPDGQYDFGDEKIVMSKGEARTERGNLAGSSITLADAVRNMVRMTPTSLQAAVYMATLAPAKAMGIENCKGSLNKGRDADLVVMNEELTIMQVWSKGTQVR